MKGGNLHPKKIRDKNGKLTTVWVSSGNPKDKSGTKPDSATKDTEQTVKDAISAMRKYPESKDNSLKEANAAISDLKGLGKTELAAKYKKQALAVYSGTEDDHKLDAKDAHASLKKRGNPHGKENTASLMAHSKKMERETTKKTPSKKNRSLAEMKSDYAKMMKDPNADDYKLDALQAEVTMLEDKLKGTYKKGKAKSESKSVLDSIWEKIIKTPLIGDKERKSLNNSYNHLTNDLEKFKLIGQIKDGYTTDEFLAKNGLGGKNTKKPIVVDAPRFEGKIKSKVKTYNYGINRDL